MAIIAKKYGVKTKAVKRTKKTKYLQIDEIVKVTTKKLKGTHINFKKIDTALLNEEVYIVVETKHLEKENVLINVFQGEEDVFAKANELVMVQHDDKDVNGLIRTKIGSYTEKDMTNPKDFENWAIAKVKLQPVGETKQKEWKDNLECNSQEKAKLYLRIDAHSENSIPKFKSEYIKYHGFVGNSDDDHAPNHFLNEESSWFEVTQNKVIDIYHDGKISKVDLKDVEKVSYVYHDKDDKRHSLGSFNLIEVEELGRGDKSLSSIPKGHTKEETISNSRKKYTYTDKIIVKGTVGDEKGKIRKYLFLNNKVKLAKIDRDINYVKDGITIKFDLMSGSTRPYINPNALACVFGAIAEVGYTDIVMVGFTSEDNHGFPSTTHVNGKHGDFRYLRTDKTGDKLDISKNPKDLDETRQEKMIDAFKNYGWPVFYSVYYTKDDKSKILKSCTDMAPHHHHLHSRRFNPNFKK